MHPTQPRRRPWPTVLLLAVTAVALALVAVVLVAPPVGAHPLGGVEPSNYRARVLAVRPPVPGLRVEVVDAGTRLRLVNGPRDVVVLGYQFEPWLRVGPRGVFENSRSPTLQTAGAWGAAQAPAAGKLLSLGASAAGWVMAGLAIRQLLRQRVESGLFQLLLGAGLLMVVGGLGDLGFLFRSQLASSLPGWMVRAAVAAKIGLGLGALAAAGLRLTLAGQGVAPGAGDSPEHPDPPAEDGPVLATVLPWPGSRRHSFDDLDDPDLPGGA
jgi:hypothetical protein